MANRYLRGTFTRNAWDFYEVGAAWVCGAFQAPAGLAGMIFLNNGIAQSYLDVFRVEFSLGAAAQLYWSVANPGSTYTAIEPNVYFNRPVQLDLGLPPGDMVAITPSFQYFSPLLKALQTPAALDSIELQNGGPFITLPPLYGLAVVANLPGPAWINLTVWYQSITDHTPPAI